MKMFIRLSVILFIIMGEATAKNCPQQGAFIQVLGSGGPEVQDKRASSSYLVWLDGKARVLIDSGGGSALRFGQSGASVADLSVVLFTHLHVDHSADFPALIKSSFFENRVNNLPVFGPNGNDLLSSTVDFVERLFNEKNGVWPYLGDYLMGTEGGEYHVLPKNINVEKRTETRVFSSGEISIHAIPVHHGPLPALAWKVTVKSERNKSVVFSGDMNGQYQTLENLANNADVLVAHNAIPEAAKGVARNLHMPPSVIGKIAAKAAVKKLVLSHRMLRTLGRENETLSIIRRYYKGDLFFADDLSCYPL